MTPFDALRPRLDVSSSEPEPGFLETSVALLLAPGAQGLDALFIRRAERADDPWSGHIGLPGGRREAGDAGLLETALRETREEIGVTVPREALLGRLDDLKPSLPTNPPLMIRPFVFGLPARVPAGTSEEVAATYWLPLHTLHAARCPVTVMIKGKGVSVPCFKIAHAKGDLVVWGLTYRILNGLLPLL